MYKHKELHIKCLGLICLKTAAKTQNKTICKVILMKKNPHGSIMNTQSNKVMHVWLESIF